MRDNLEYLATLLKNKGYKATITTQYGRYTIGNHSFPSLRASEDYIASLPSKIQPLVSL